MKVVLYFLSSKKLALQLKLCDKYSGSGLKHYMFILSTDFKKTELYFDHFGKKKQRLLL